MQAVFTQSDFYIELNAFDDDVHVEIHKKFSENKSVSQIETLW